MQIRKTGLYSLATAALALSLWSCGSSEKAASTETTQDSATAVVEQNAQVLEAVDALLTKLPRPSVIPNLIALSGAEYQAKLVNPASSAEKVLSNSAKSAFTIGVMCADVGYQAAYEKGQDALNTFVIGKKLADKIGVTSAFDPAILGRIEKNLTNKDSLILISDASMEQSSGILKSNDQFKDAGLLTAGAFVEGLYLTCGLIHDYPPTGLPKAEQDKILVPLVGAVVKQEEALKSLIELLKTVNDNDQTLTDLISQLERAKAIYEKGNWGKKITENKGSLILTENDIHELATAIAGIRNSMVQ